MILIVPPYFQHNRNMEPQLDEYRGYNGFNGRSKLQIMQDFEECCSLLQSKKTWTEVAFIINELRDYTVTQGALQKSYAKIIRDTALKMSVEDEKRRLIDDLDSIMFKAITQFNETVGMSTKTRISGHVIKGTNELSDPYKVVDEFKNAGDTKFLDIFLKALKQKERLVIPKAEKADNTFNIAVFMKDSEIYEGENPDILPIMSEDDMKKLDSDYE